MATARELERLSPTMRDLIRLLIADAQDEVRQATELAVRMASGQTRREVAVAMDISYKRSQELAQRIERALTRGS